MTEIGSGWNNLSENMKKIRKKVNEENEAAWRASERERTAADTPRVSCNRLGRGGSMWGK